MGLTFKENCADIRNSGVNNIIKKLKKYNCNLNLYDPWAEKVEIMKLYNIKLNEKLNSNNYDAVVIAVAHDKFKRIGENKIRSLCKKKHVIFDLKSLFSKDNFSLRL